MLGYYLVAVGATNLFWACSYSYSWKYGTPERRRFFRLYSDFIFPTIATLCVLGVAIVYTNVASTLVTNDLQSNRAPTLLSTLGNAAISGVVWFAVGFAHIVCDYEQSGPGEAVAMMMGGLGGLIAPVIVSFLASSTSNSIWYSSLASAFFAILSLFFGRASAGD